MVFFFPGQGSQFLGMGSNFIHKYKIASNIFEQANDILGYDIQNICFEGPDDKLMLTKYAQPAILIYQYILLNLLEEKGIYPDIVLGHSLGEFTAILAAKILNFEDTLTLVQKRGEIMFSSDPKRKGAMSAVLGLPDDIVIDICKEISKEYYVEAVNFNAPGQIVISGLKEGIEKAGQILLTKGAKRIVPLAVSGAFHSELMQESADIFAKLLDKINFHHPICRVVSNVTGSYYNENTIKTLLSLHMKSPVQWISSIEKIIDDGHKCGIEISEKTVIQSLVSKINKQFVFTKIETLF